MAAYDFTPMFDNVMIQGLLDNPSFSFFFSDFPVQQSVFLLGDPDPSLYVGDISWLPVVKEFYWEVVLTVSVGWFHLSSVQKSCCLGVSYCWLNRLSYILQLTYPAF